jgi:hypothetical protein
VHVLDRHFDARLRHLAYINLVEPLHLADITLIEPEHNHIHSHVMAPNKISELSTIIFTNTQKVDTYLTDRNLPTPSLDASASAYPIPDDAPTEIKEAAVTAAEAYNELNALMTGPRELVRFNVSLHKYKLRTILTTYIVDCMG